MRVTTDINEICFPCELDTLGIDELSGKVRVTLTAGGASVFDATLTPDADKAVTLTDLASVLTDCTADGDAADCTLEIEELAGSTVAEYSFTLLPCRIHMDDPMTAVDFCKTHFLTLLQGDKPTYAAATEYLSLYSADGNESNAITHEVWVNDEGEVKEQTSLLVQSFTIGFSRLYVSPRRFTAPADGYALHSYTVVCGERSQCFVLRETIDAEPMSLLFRNAFGREETFHCFGTTQTELKPTRSAASFGGRTRNYKVQAVPEFTAHTGLMPPSVFLLFEDLCASLKVTLLGERGGEVTLTDNELKLSNDLYEPQQGSVTWRFAGRARTFVPTESARTFDKSFDSSFF